MKKPSFFQCTHCGNTIGLITDAGVSMYCCGDPMKALHANTEDATQEKHIPSVSAEGNLVTVDIGSVDHPMTPDHRIEWVYLLSEKGGQRKELRIENRPSVCFSLTDDDSAIEVYAYCNLHGLWSTAWR